MFGAIFAAAAAWVVLGDDFGGDRIISGGTWRHYALIAALPAATALFLSILWVPESPRYLAKTGVCGTVVNSRLGQYPTHEGRTLLLFDRRSGDVCMVLCAFVLDLPRVITTAERV